LTLSSNSPLFNSSELNPDIVLMCNSLSPIHLSLFRGPLCTIPMVSPRFWPQWLPGLPCRPSFRLTGCTATQRLSAFPSLRSHSFSGWLRRSVHPRSLGPFRARR
jgi:hypothetical protein